MVTAATAAKAGDLISVLELNADGLGQAHNFTLYLSVVKIG